MVVDLATDVRRVFSGEVPEQLLTRVDNEAARYSAIKGISPSPVMRILVREFYRFELESPTFSWVERVPSYSNIADGPSRNEPSEAMQLLGTETCIRLEHPPELITKLLSP